MSLRKSEHVVMYDLTSSTWAAFIPAMSAISNAILPASFLLDSMSPILTFPMTANHAVPNISFTKVDFFIPPLGS